MNEPTIQDVETYWSRRPCNIRHGTAPVGSLEWSRQVTQRKYFVEPHIRGFAQFERWRGKRVIEIGTGLGTDTMEFARHGACIETVDVSMESLKLAWERFKQESFDGSYSFTCADAEGELPFRPNADGSFDLGYCWGMLHHTPHPERVLANLHALLKRAGELRIMVYAKYSLKHLLGTQPEAQAGCPIVKWYSGWEARKLLWACGFDVVSINKTHIFKWTLSDYLEHRYVKHWAYRWMPDWMFHALERIGGHHLLIIAKKKEAS
jgi:ubiquinone/menaquinone biosynthesis C-methylase UbiE